MGDDFMTLNQLKYVIALSEENSINEAAKKLFISQPALTSALRMYRKAKSRSAEET